MCHKHPKLVAKPWTVN